MIDANAPITLLETLPQNVFMLWTGFQRNLRYRCNIHPTELSKPHGSGRVWVWPFMFSGSNIRHNVMAAFTSFILSSFNCYCWTSITIGLNHFPILHMVSQRSKILSKLYFHSHNAYKLVTQEASKRTDIIHCASQSKQYMTSYLIKTQILQIHAITIFEQ